MLRFWRSAALALLLPACGGAPTAAPSAPKALPTTKTAPLATDEPCAASLRVLRALRAPVRIEARVARGTPPLDAFAAELEHLLERYRRASAGKLAFSIVDAKDAGDAGVVIDYGGERAQVQMPATDRARELELGLLLPLRTLVDRVDGNKRSIGVLVGHGERRLDAFELVAVPARGEQASLADIIEKYFPEYRFVNVDLGGGASEIDPTLDGLLVLQPSADLDDKELRLLDAFVMRGKSLVVAASAVNLTRASGMATAHVGAHRLDRLLAGYGITLHEDVVLDFGQSFTVDVSTPNGTRTMRFPQIPRAADGTLEAGFSPFFRITDVALPYASSVTVRPDAQPNARVRVVAKTSARATAETAADVDLSLVQRWRVPEAFDQLALAAASEGTLKSAFGNTTSARPARVLLIASASPFANAFVGAKGATSELEDRLAAPYAQRTLANAVLVFKNTLDWMTFDDDLATCLR